MVAIAFTNMATENVTPVAEGDPVFDGLDPLKARLVQMLMEGRTMPEAAAEIGRSERRLRVWRKEPAVKAALKLLMGEAMGRARVVLTSGAIYAAMALVEMAAGVTKGEDDEDIPVVADPARVAACKAVLETAARLAETEDLSDRIDDLESQMLLGPSGTQPLPPADPADGQGCPQ